MKKCNPITWACLKTNKWAPTWVDDPMSLEVEEIARSQVTRLYWHLPTLPPDKTYRCATGLADYGCRWERWVAPNSNGSQIQKNTIFYTMGSNILGRIYDVFKTVHVKNAGHLYMPFNEVMSKNTSQWSWRYCRGSLWNQHISALATGLKKWVQLRRKKSLLFWCWITNLYRV